MKLVLAQIGSKLGDIAGNTARVIEFLNRSECKGSDLIVFPELCLTGYPPRDLLDCPSLVPKNLEALQSIAKSVGGGTHVILGYVEKNPNSFGKPFHNAAAWIHDGKIHGRYFKRLLPYYSVFEDERYFEPGTETVVWDIAGKRVGVTICEDGWNEPGFVPRLYSTDPMRQLGDKKCDLVVNLSASPFHLGKPAWRHQLFATGARKCKAPIAFCNQVAAHDDLIFDGSSFAVDAAGKLVATAPAFEASCLIVSDFKQSALPLKWSEAEWISKALQFGIREYCQKSGVQKVILGLSGGIDSAVVAGLVAAAMGPENTIGVSLPSRFTSAETRRDARQIAENLGIEFHEFSMDAVFEQYRTEIQRSLGMASPIVEENLQPRIRMILLMALSQQFGALLLNTSNKSEIACGYATLYGDTAGALSVLGDLTKERVYDLARQLNSVKRCIPDSVLERAPSAELRPDQKDEDSLPPYRVLDKIVTDAVEHQFDGTELGKRYDAAHVSTFERLYQSSEFKRFQMPPVLRVTPRALGAAAAFRWRPKNHFNGCFPGYCTRRHFGPINWPVPNL